MTQLKSLINNPFQISSEALIQRLDVYERVLEENLAKEWSIEASHNHAMLYAGLTDFGLIKARSATGQPATFKAGVWPRK